MLSSKGHAVAIPQDMNISRSLPKLPEEVGIVVLRRKGSNQTTKHYFVKRSAVDNALKGIGIDFQKKQAFFRNFLLFCHFLQISCFCESEVYSSKERKLNFL